MRTRIRASVVCIHDAKILVFRGVDPKTEQNYLFLPGGKIEKGETPWRCCEREALEETGYKLRVRKETEFIATYNHWWNGTQYNCKTYFYRGSLAEPWREPGDVTDVDYNKGPLWLPMEKASDAFGYTPEILAAVLRLST